MGFLTAHPNDPAADQAAFSLANALLDLERYEEAIDKCRKFAERYPKSDDLDGFWYTHRLLSLRPGPTPTSA